MFSLLLLAIRLTKESKFDWFKLCSPFVLVTQWAKSKRAVSYMRDSTVLKTGSKLILTDVTYVVILFIVRPYQNCRLRITLDDFIV